MGIGGPCSFDVANRSPNFCTVYFISNKQDFRIIDFYLSSSATCLRRQSRFTFHMFLGFE